MSEPVQTQSYLLLFSIGPVQGFIETARKAQDLWAGSFLLSRLVKQAATEASQQGASVIFPAIGHKVLGSAAALPNHLLLHLETGWDPGRIRTLTTTLGDSVRATFSCMITHGMQQLAKERVEDISPRQIQDFLEISWAAVPLDPHKYGDSFGRVESALAGRKRIRIFDQIQPEHSLKCSLCGERQALHPQGEEKISATRHFWRGLRSQGFTEGEYLCAICLGKRFAPQWFVENAWTTQQRFPSTAEMAAAPFRALVSQECRGELEAFETEAVKTFGKTGCLLPLVRSKAERTQSDAVDAHWFFPENLEDSVIEKELGKNTNGSNIREKLIALNESADAHPSRYFAVLMMDGDRMGKILGRIRAIEEHERLSRLLASFASSKAPELVENGKYAGRLVYSGGDDLLAFVAVDHLLPLMEALRQAFAESLNGAFPELVQGAGFTMSAGACIGHYKAPLRFVLKSARSMLALAKSPRGGNRNAFALSLFRHSGSQEEAWAGWGPDENPLVPDLVKFSGYLNTGTLSDRFLYNLRREFAPLIGDDGKLLGLGRSVYAVDPLKAELKRMILRASHPVDQNPEDKGLSKMAETAAHILEETVERDMHARNFFSLLSIVNMISRESIS